MARELQEGRTLPYTATAAIDNNELLVIGAIGAVAPVAAVTGDRIDMRVEGVFRLTKKAAANTDGAIGAKAYAIATGGVRKITGLATGATEVGTFWAAAATGDVLANVKLHGHAV